MRHDKSFNNLWQSYNSNSIIITVNNRLSKILLDDYKRKTEAVATNPLIFPLEQWLINNWQHFSSASSQVLPTLISSIQQLHLWQLILQKNNDIDFDNYKTAILANQAWKLIYDYDIDLQQPEFNYDDEAQKFCQWAQLFKQHCEQNNLISINQLLKNYKIDFIKLDENITQAIFYGFSELTPNIEKLQLLLQQQDIAVRNIEEQQNNPQLEYITFEDSQAEIIDSINWAIAMATARKRVAIVVPDLQKKRDFISNHIETLVKPQNIIANISLGQPLEQYYLIKTALEILNLSINPTIETFSTILRSPFISGSNAEKHARHTFDKKLRRNIWRTFSWDSINHLLQQESDLSIFAEKLTALQERMAEIPENCQINEWVAIFIDFLNLMGWPKEKPLTSDEAQLQNKFIEIMQQLSGLNIFNQQYTQLEAVSLLQQSLKLTIFQPRQREKAQIEFLGMFEAGSHPCDAMRIISLNDKNWPATSNPNSLLPLAVQRRYKIANSSYQKQFEFAEKVLIDIKKMPQQLIISYAKNHDGEEVAASCFVEQPQRVITSSSAKYKILNLPLEVIENQKLTPITANSINGGARTLELQAKCPFRAAAESRFKLQPLLPWLNFISPRERGIIIHDSLENIYSTIKTKLQLQQLDKEQINELVVRAVARSLRKLGLIIGRGSNYIKIEITAIKDLLLQLLQLEQQRNDFSIKYLEKKHDITIDNMAIDFRIDRIDEVEDGLIIMDYKTGKPNLNEWFDERLTNPQLPLYVLALQQKNEISAVVFAIVNIETVKYLGISQNDDILPKIKSIGAKDMQWQQLIQLWHNKITTLVHEYKAGEAFVSPANEKVCSSCNLHGFCRISEKIAQGESTQ